MRQPPASSSCVRALAPAAVAAAALALGAPAGCGGDPAAPAATPGAAPAAPTPELVYDVHTGDDIQSVLETAARDERPGRKRVRVHAGTYRPRRPGQALVWFNARHDGITLEAVGEVVLTAGNAEVADVAAESFPAVVNHVVFFGDGISPRTVLRGFRITGANGFVTRDEDGGAIEPFSVHPELRRGLFFYADGGGIKIFGRSYPTLERLVIHDNYASPCAGGLSVEHRGFVDGRVTIRDCVFRDNRCQITGSAIDLLPGSSALVENCLFVGNLSNRGEDFVSPRGAEHSEEHGSGALTVFEGSRVEVRRCTFTANWNGVDDQGRGNRYVETIFWRNVRDGGVSPGARYEIDIGDGRGVRGCFVHGAVDDLRGTVDPAGNVLAAPDPDFDGAFVPRAAAYAGVGYRPPGGES